MDKPKIIEKRFFTCLKCGYRVQVFGEQYFDYGCRNYMATFSCRECKILFENVISKMECWEPLIVTHNLADEIVCLGCGTDKNNVWNKESGLCPKCEGEMGYEEGGIIKVDYEK
jgi:hypothetical protein